MIKRILILLFAFISFSLSAQSYFVADTNGNYYYTSGYIMSDSVSQPLINSSKYITDNGLVQAAKANKYDPDDWINTILIDNFDIRNSHYSNDFKAYSLPILRESLQPDYEDSADTGYLYNTFGIDGLNRTVADFILIYELRGATNNIGISKSGTGARWNFEGNIQASTNTPTSYTPTGDNSMIISFSDSVGSLTSVDFRSENLTGNIPYFDAPNLISNLYASNGCVGAVPNSIMMPSNCWFTSNDLETTPSLTNTISTNLGSLLFTNNELDLTSVDNLLSELNAFFTTNTPIKNLTVNLSGGTSASPTGGSSNTDLVNLRDVLFPNAGFTFTITIN